METPPVRKPPSPPPEFAPQRVYSAPRRFGIGTMLAVATACGLLIGLLQLFDTPAPVIIAISVFLAIVAGMQAVFPDSPRWASIATGTVCVVLCYAYMWATEFRDPCALCGLPFVIAFGLFAGYCGGAVVAGFFMVMEHASGYIRRTGEEDQTSPSIWDDEPEGPNSLRE